MMRAESFFILRRKPVEVRQTDRLVVIVMLWLYAWPHLFHHCGRVVQRHVVVFLNFPLFSHTHTNILTHTHTYSHTHTNILTHSRTHTHTQGYDISFLITNFHTEQMYKHKLVDFVIHVSQHQQPVNIVNKLPEEMKYFCPSNKAQAFLGRGREYTACSLVPRCSVRGLCESVEILSLCEKIQWVMALGRGLISRMVYTNCYTVHTCT